MLLLRATSGRTCQTGSARATPRASCHAAVASLEMLDPSPGSGVCEPATARYATVSFSAMLTTSRAHLLVSAGTPLVASRRAVVAFEPGAGEQRALAAERSTCARAFGPIVAQSSVHVPDADALRSRCAYVAQCRGSMCYVS